MALEFEKQDRESGKAFAAFAVYLSMGSERSLAQVGKKLGKSAGLIERWSKRYDWGGRVQAHAAHFAMIEREATEAVARGKAAEWLTRQEKIRDREWSMHEKCLAAAERALASFMEREKVYANLSDIARILEVASKLGRLAAGMATDRTEVTGEDGGPIRVELSAALSKIYGDVVDVECTSPRPSPQSGEGERRELPEGSK